MGYDRNLTIFSPAGRLFQVEYALEAVKRAPTVVGVRTRKAVVLAAYKQLSPLEESGLSHQVSKITDMIGLGASGISSDSRILLDYARMEAQANLMLYDEPVEVETLTRKLATLKQLYTQKAGVRPFGASLLVAGIDQDGGKLFQTDPSGAYWGFKAVAIGNGAVLAKNELESHYTNQLNLDQATQLAVKALDRASRRELTSSNVDMATISQDQLFKKASYNEIKGILQSLQKRRS